MISPTKTQLGLGLELKFVPGDYLKPSTQISDSTGSLVMEKQPTRASPEVGGKSVVSIVMVVLLPAPLDSEQAEHLAGFGSDRLRIDRCEHTEATGLAFYFNNRTHRR